MSSCEPNTVRALGALELEQVVGGDCPGGANCDCPGTTQWIAGGGASVSVWFQNCAGYLYENGHYRGRR